MEKSITERIRSALARRPRIFLVQVGSNDGLHGDPIHELILEDARWSGIMIEPVPYVFQRLMRNHGNAGRFRLLNIAIGEREEERNFYYVSEEARDAIVGLPWWYDQLGSFDRQHIVSHLNGLLEPYIVSERLPCKTLQRVLDEGSVRHVDIIHIDTEGYDVNVLRQIDFLRYQPKVVLYEHKHLRVADKDLAAGLLQTAGYELHSYEGDNCAIHPHW